MYFSIPSATYSDILRRAKLAMGKQNLPILGTARFTVSPCGRTLEVTTTDLDITLAQRIPLEDMGGPGSICLELRQLTAIRPDKNTPVRIDHAPYLKEFTHGNSDSQILYVAAGMSATAPLESFPASEFPDPPAIPASDHTCLLPGKTLATLAASIPFQSKDETRYVLNGALLDSSAGGSIIATDGKRLFQSSAKVTPESVILPSKACNILARLAPASAAAALHDHVHQPGNTTRFLSIRTSAFTLTSKLIEGNYPNYHQVIPTDFNSSITFADPTGLAKWLASLPEKATANSVHLTPRAPHFVDLVHSHGNLTATAYLQGNPCSIAFNSHFFADALTAAPGTLRLMDEMSPAVLRTTTALVVLMPMRITTEATTPAPKSAAAA